MNSLNNFEITGQLSGQAISDSPLQQSNDLILGLQQEIGLITLAQDPNFSDQSKAIKSVEIMLDDMSFNLSSHLTESKLQQSFASNCLQESIKNINEFIIEQEQLKSDDHSNKGVSLSVIQILSDGLSCSMHGDLSCFKLSNDTFELLGNKVSIAKSLGINPALSFTIHEDTLEVNDIVLLAKHSLIEQLGHKFIRMTLSRFGDTLSMAIRQINARASKMNINQEISFVLCRKTSLSDSKKGWFK